MGSSTTSSDTRPPPPEPEPRKKVKKQPPQKTVDQLWEAFTTKYPGKVHSVLPNNVYAQTKAAKVPKGVVHGEKAGKSYDEAVAECKSAVEKIAKECRRVNMKYRDPHFDIEFDLKRGVRDCLDGLVQGDYQLNPKSVKRVTQIFEDPMFVQEGATASDVRQGGNGDCWFMSALCALGGKQDLINNVCIARDEKVGVYGFVFHRDGEWIQTIIDDKLYLIASDWDESMEEKWTWQQINRADAEEEYRKSNQTGSRALYFAQCRSENETWLPLLEKAYAKAHGDFNSIQGGFTGEAIEDLTGGVTTELFTSDILDTDKFWTDEIMKVNDEFLFGCATGAFDNWQGASWLTDRKDIISMHAYSILEAKEIKGERLLRVRNPWGQTEWKGAWSDGSEQWTPEWMQLLNHKFGDDGMFWISYKDLLRKFQSFDRTRLFDSEWSVTQQWTTIDVPWSADYNETKFSVTLSKPSPVVIVLSKLDERYFQGLEGQYDFSLHFRLERDGEHDYIVRSHGNYLMDRSVSVDLDLEPGTYSVLMKITAKRVSYRNSPEQVVRDTCRDRQEKLIQIGLAYDLAHAKGQIKETDAEKKDREEREAKKKAKAHQKRREELRAKWLRNWEIEKKRVARQKRHVKKKEEHYKKIEARKAATAAALNKEAVDVDKNAVARADDQVEAVDRAEQQETLKATEGGIQDESAGTDGQADGEVKEAEAPAVEGATEQPGESNVAPPAETAETAETAEKAGPVQDASQPTKDAATMPSPPPDDQTAETKPIENETKADTAASEKAAKFEAALQNVPSVFVNGAALTDNAPNTAPGTAGAALPIGGTIPPPSTAAEDNTWEYDSLASFDSSMDTDLDIPPTPPPEATNEAVAIGAAPPLPEEEDENQVFEDDPWNAVCVVGLRVYSKDKDTSILIVRPKTELEGETELDIDDNSKGASGEVSGKDKEGEGAEEKKSEDDVKTEVKEGITEDIGRV